MAIEQACKKNIYFIQPNFPFGSSIYLPYAVGCLAAYAWSDSFISKECAIAGIVGSRENINEVLDSFERPYMVAFSCYIWSVEYNLALAHILRERYPDCIIVFGGHSIPEFGGFLEEHGDIDYLIHNEGEQPFHALLSCLLKNEDVSAVPQLSYRRNGSVCTNEESFPLREDFPSPYAMGIFDTLLKENKYSYSAVFETNRGCPFGCAFCDWGSLRTKIRQFSMERVRADIKWFSENKIEYIYASDSNFGILERDIEIVNLLVLAKRETGYPCIFRVNYAKHSDDRVFEINSILHAAGMCKGVTLSFQSLSPAALANINRKNVPFGEFARQIVRYERAGMPAYTEVLLGLPGDTYDSFSDGLEQLLEAGQHNSLFVYNCELLPNARMGSAEYIEQHKLKAVKTAFGQDHSDPEDDDIKEFSHIIVSTDTMDENEWIRTCLISQAVQVFHKLGLLQCFAMYLHFEKGIRYVDFYRDLLELFENSPNSVGGRIYSKIKKSLEGFVKGEEPWHIVDSRFGKYSWPKEEGWFLFIAAENDAFFDELRPFLSSYEIERGIFEELIAYQRNIIKLPFRKSFVLENEYDWHEYFESILLNETPVLKKKPNLLRVDKVCSFASLEEYAVEVVWYGRRSSKIVYSDVEVEYGGK